LNQNGKISDWYAKETSKLNEGWSPLISSFQSGVNNRNNMISKPYAKVWHPLMLTN
jgi:hypothetical protein